MKLLLIEDERLTREGIRSSVSWEALGIGEIREAVDGLDALEAAAGFMPDIILTDVRMPRMDGVEASFQLRKMYPDSKIIFLSGYADKSYLKAAISLKAVGYVEKPVDLEELEEALQQAVALCMEDQRKSELDAAAQDTIRQEMALELLRKGLDEDALRSRLSLTGMQLPGAGSAVSLVVRIDEPEEVPAGLGLSELVSGIARRNGLQQLFAQKDGNVYVLHLFGELPNPFTSITIRSVSQELSDSLRSSGYVHVLAAGKPVSGLDRVYESYFTAVMMLQESFFYGPYSLLIHSDELKPAYEPDFQAGKALQQLLKEGNWEGSEALVRELARTVRQYPGTLVASVKDWFYRLLLEIEEFGSQHHVNAFPKGSRDHLLWSCLYLEEVCGIVIQALVRLKAALQEKSGTSTASRIMRYIHLHYADDTLSVTGISQEMQITSSHLIALFRETTGTTVKQYLMEYRVEKAKELLLDGQRLKVFDVASQVGFKDGEHFAKMFRKYTGMTPSEYREKYAP